MSEQQEYISLGVIYHELQLALTNGRYDDHELSHSATVAVSAVALPIRTKSYDRQEVASGRHQPYTNQELLSKHVADDRAEFRRI